MDARPKLAKSPHFGDLPDESPDMTEGSGDRPSPRLQFSPLSPTRASTFPIPSKRSTWDSNQPKEAMQSRVRAGLRGSHAADLTKDSDRDNLPEKHFSSTAASRKSARPKFGRNVHHHIRETRGNVAIDGTKKYYCSMPDHSPSVANNASADYPEDDVWSYRRPWLGTRVKDDMWSHASSRPYLRDDSESSSNASLEATEAFDFDLPSIFRPDIVEAVDDTKASDQAKRSIQSIADMTSLTIVKSRWHKDPTAGKPKSSFEATLGRSTHSEFMWYHVERRVKNFSVIYQIISQIQGLSSEERNEAREFLDAVRDNHEKCRPYGCELQPASFVASSDRAIDKLPIAFAALEIFQHRLLQQHGSFSTHDHSSHPLLEHSTHQQDWSRERDQVLHLKNGTRQERCLYISSCWLVLVAGHLISISDMPYLALLPPTSKLNVQPLATTSSNSVPTLAVIYGDRSWEVPLEACERWPCLVATFLDAFAQRAWGLNLMHGSTALTPTVWSKLKDRISRGPLKLRLVRTFSEQSDIMDGLQHEIAALTALKADVGYPSSEDLPSSDESGDMYHSKLYDMPLLRIFSLSKQPSNDDIASKIASELHGVLLHSSMALVASAYRKCCQAKPSDVDEWLSLVFGEQAGNSEIVWLKAELAIYIKHTYSFFWPWNLEHEMLSKFWFMLRRFLNYPHDDEKDRPNLLSMKKKLRKAIKSVMWISITFAHDLDCVPSLPQQFLKAWCHLELAMLLLSQPSRPFNASIISQDAANVHLEQICQ